MQLKTLRVPLAMLVTIAIFSASGTVIASAALPARITLCYNRRTGAVRVIRSGRCGAASTAIVVGRGAAGVRGPVGPRGIVGPSGAAGATGSSGPPGVNTFHTVSAVSTANSGPFTVLCPTGEVVTGGGFVTSASVSGVAFTDSFPNALRNGWTVNFTGGPTVTVTAYAICVAGVNT